MKDSEEDARAAAIAEVRREAAARIHRNEAAGNAEARVDTRLAVDGLTGAVLVLFLQLVAAWPLASAHPSRPSPSLIWLSRTPQRVPLAT